MENKLGLIDPNDYDNWEENSLRPGGGGGGGGKKKEKHQGKKTQNKMQENLTLASKANVSEYDAKHPEVSDDIDTGIDITLGRIVESDTGSVSLPNLEKYVYWLYQRLNSNEVPEVGEECDLEFTKSSGPGGQNKNKVATAVRLTHRYMGIRFLKDSKRTQEGNRGDAIRRAELLVEDHMEKWMNYLVSREGEMRRIIVQKLRAVLVPGLSEKTVPKNKKEAFDKFCRMMGRWPVDYVFE